MTGRLQQALFRVGLSFFLLMAVVEASAADPGLFPKSEYLQARVQFWRDIYARYSADEFVVHDSRYPDIRYDVVSLPKSKHCERSRRERMKTIRQQYAAILRKLDGKPPLKSLSSEERRIYDLFHSIAGSNKFRDAASRVRSQAGIKEEFRAGISRAGRYMPMILEAFRRYQLPPELAALPHVESSFNYQAYSKVGAAGIWQFTYGTGRLFLTINYEVDERRDPIAATDAAARLLTKNFEALGNWPLAITAYNHGLQGMKRAVRATGTSNLDTIIEKYRSRSFGFASKNFYCEFLAACELVAAPEKYFGALTVESPIHFDTFRLPEYISVSILEKYCALSRSELQRLNPHLRSSVYADEKRIPAGFELRLPAGTEQEFRNAYRQIPAGYRHPSQKRSQYYRVQRGDTLSAIARRFNTSVSALKHLNNLRSSHRIYINQVLRLPGAPAAETAITGRSESVPVEALATPVVKEPTTVPISTKQVAFTISVLPEETLDLYAQWSGLSRSTIARLNRFSSRQRLKIGQSVQLRMPVSKVAEFETQRNEYHRELQIDFLKEYQVTSTLSHTVRRGQTMWQICNRIYSIPVWLLEQHNEGIDLENLRVGQVLTIPIVEPVKQPTGGS